MRAIANILILLSSSTLIQPCNAKYDILRHFSHALSWRDTDHLQHHPTEHIATVPIYRRNVNQPFDEREFNSSATSHCQDALGTRNSVANPSGMAACYNIPFLNHTTGVFATDVRLFQVSSPTGAFKGSRWQDYSMQLNILVAEVFASERVGLNFTQSGNGSTMVLEFRHIGKLNPIFKFDILTLQQFQILLIPNITLSTPNPNNKAETVTATLAFDTLSYVAGRLADKNGSPHNITIPEAHSQLVDIILNTTQFVLPGISLGIYPIGLIVTSIWAGLFVLVVGFGTFERKRYRDVYRQSVKVAASTPVQPPRY
ncbi:hypothetical protein FQN57_005952 [Myotisia sp. PD_48]|nr:hypothetical protein FQN57_005952 [Myotisia sp. PD_48]